jgi:uncharacterized protein
MKKSRRRILIDICHPAEVHHFKYVYQELAARGWSILFAAKDKDVVEALLLAYDLPHVLFSESQEGILKKLLHVPVELWRFAKIVRAYRPTFILSNLSIHSSWISYLFRITHIAFIDTEHRRVLDYVTLPFADVKLTPRAYQRCLGQNHIRYNGNHEVTYLHPLRYRADSSIREVLGLEADEKYVILRFVGWHAFHDVGLTGLDLAKKMLLVEQLSQARRVFISSETALPEPLLPFLLKISVERMHDALACADAYIGEGGTMASEAACLGTPAAYLNSLRLGYVDEEERYGLLQQFDRLDHRALNTILATGKSIKHAAKASRFWRDQLDVVDFIVKFLHNYPGSLYRNLYEEEFFCEKKRANEKTIFNN